LEDLTKPYNGDPKKPCEESPQAQQGQQGQRFQKPAFVEADDYYIKMDNPEKNNGKYCLVTGKIDHDKKIIYSAKLVEVYDEAKVIEALMNYSKIKANTRNTN
jgi:hypothetical protein